MKSVAITVAAWVASFSTWQDGDVFRESQIDIISGEMADRFGYLKNALDGKASLSGTNTWTAMQTIQPSDGGAPIGLRLYRELHFVSTATSPGEATRAGLHHRKVILPDVDGTYAPDGDTFIVPQTGGNRIYRFGPNGGNDGRRIRIVRPRVGDAQTVTVQDSGSNTIAVFPSGAAGWIDIEFDVSKTPQWLPVSWSSTLTSVVQTV